jgi:hypothetical protein
VASNESNRSDSEATVTSPLQNSTGGNFETNIHYPEDLTYNPDSSTVYTLITPVKFCILIQFYLAGFRSKSTHRFS